MCRATGDRYRDGELLDYFARQATDLYQTDRIGLTSVNRRLVPLTRDHQYAAARFGEYARARAAQSASFAPPVPYTDYAGSVEDALALCISGFPSFEKHNTRRRSVIYLGPSDLRAAGEKRAALFSDGAVRDLAVQAEIQLNVVDTAPSPASGSLAALTSRLAAGIWHRGGIGGRGTQRGTQEIRTNTPPARRADGTVVTADSWDAPVIPLTIAIAVGGRAVGGPDWCYADDIPAGAALGRS